MTHGTFVLILACLFAVAAPAFAELYKWVDENGTVHFSEVPPEVAPPGGVETRDTRPVAPVVTGQPAPPPEKKEPLPPPAITSDEEAEEDVAEDEGETAEPSDSGNTISTGEELIYNPDVMDRLRLEKARREAAGSTGGRAPARPARGGGRR